MASRPEKVSALRTEEYFAERATRDGLKKALRVLKRAGRGKPPLPGDELPAKLPRRFTELDDADLESYLERLTTPAPKQARCRVAQTHGSRAAASEHS
jgi:hypothetical protein